MGAKKPAPRCHAVVPLPTALALRPQLLWKGLQRVRENSVVPPGLEFFLPFSPALKRWANLGRPSGAGFFYAWFHWTARKRVLTHMLHRFSIGTNSRVSCPIQTWRGRAIFCSGSVSISCHCESQPMVRGIANSTVNISGLKPIAW